MHTIEIYLKSGATIEIKLKTEDGDVVQEAMRLLDALDDTDIQGFIDRNLDGTVRSSIQVKSRDITGYRVYDGLKFQDPSFYGAINIQNPKPKDPSEVAEKMRKLGALGQS